MSVLVIVIAAFREAIRRDPEAADPHNGLGCALDAVNRFAEAETEFRVRHARRPGTAGAGPPPFVQVAG